MTNAGLEVKKNLDTVFDDRVRGLVKEVLDPKLEAFFTNLKQLIYKEKANSLMIVDGELNKFSEEANNSFRNVMENFEAMGQRMGAIDLELAALLKTLYDKELVKPDEVKKEYTTLYTSIAQAIQEKVKEMQAAENKAEPELTPTQEEVTIQKDSEIQIVEALPDPAVLDQMLQEKPANQDIQQ